MIYYNMWENKQADPGLQRKNILTNREMSGKAIKRRAAACFHDDPGSNVSGAEECWSVCWEDENVPKYLKDKANA